MSAPVQPLSPADAAFLSVENRNCYVALGGLEIFRPDGSDLRTIKNELRASAEQLPRLRQRVEVTSSGWPAWVDDPNFRIEHHFRLTILPEPRDRESLLAAVAATLSRPLPRARPLWQVEVFSPLASGEFALLLRAHHCMMDGVAAISTLRTILSPTRKPFAGPIDDRAPTSPLESRAAATSERLLGLAMQARTAVPGVALGLSRMLSSAAEQSPASLSNLASSATRHGLESLPKEFLKPCTSSPLTGSVGSSRAMCVGRTAIGQLDRLRTRFDCTLNDLVVYLGSSAIRAYLQPKGFDPARMKLRAFIPTADVEGERQASNDLDLLLAPLHINIADPARRLRATIDSMKQAKSGAGLGLRELTERIGGLVPPKVTGALVRTLQRYRFASTIISNLPGPRDHWYLGPHELLEHYPFVPLYPNIRLTMGVISYGDDLHWGFKYDPEALPDATAFPRLVEAALEGLELCV